MLKFVVLGSGSKGNATFVDVDGFQFLIDCGFTKIQTKKRLATIGKVVEDIRVVLVTHYHGDHCSPWIVKEGLVKTIPGIKGSFPGIIESFSLSHDDPCTGYTITDRDGNKMGLVTDTGCIPELAIPHLLDCDALLIETGYDIEMLIDSPYPIELQERIASTTGHLRFECAAEFIELLEMNSTKRLKTLVAMHLSSTCINPTLLKFELDNLVAKISPGCEVIITNQKTPSKMVTLI